MNMMSEAAVEKALDQKMNTVPFKMIGKDVSVYYGEKRALFDVNLNVRENTVTALIGPSGCGKSTFLRCTQPHERHDRHLSRQRKHHPRRSADIYDPSASMWWSCAPAVGMVFQKPNPFPKSIYENIAYGPKHTRPGQYQGLSLMQIVESQPAKAPVSVRTRSRTGCTTAGTGLSGGQQQRLCIARAIAISPEVILMDEPCSALDPIATAKVEELIDELRDKLHHRHRDTLHAAGRARLAAHGHVPPGQPGGRRRHRQDVHESRRPAYTRLHYRSFWLRTLSPP